MLNSYLNTPTVGYVPTQDLFNRMVIENIQISGQDYVYIPRTFNKLDMIFGEDVLSSFESYATIEMYLLDFKGFQGNSLLISKFGLEIQDSASFVVSRQRFHDVVVPIFPESRNDKLKWRPCEGDLIFSPFNNSLFEIKYVDDVNPGFYQFNKRYVWTIRCELVTLNNDKFVTGNTTVDTLFGENYNRLNNVIKTESNDNILLETGGVMIIEDYEDIKPYNDMKGFGDNTQLKQEFLDIMQFDPDDPFNERRT